MTWRDSLAAARAAMRGGDVSEGRGGESGRWSRLRTVPPDVAARGASVHSLASQALRGAARLNELRDGPAADAMRTALQDAAEGRSAGIDEGDRTTRAEADLRAGDLDSALRELSEPVGESETTAVSNALMSGRTAAAIIRADAAANANLDRAEAVPLDLRAEELTLLADADPEAASDVRRGWSEHRRPERAAEWQAEAVRVRGAD